VRVRCDSCAEERFAAATECPTMMSMTGQLIRGPGWLQQLPFADASGTRHQPCLLPVASGGSRRRFSTGHGWPRPRRGLSCAGYVTLFLVHVLRAIARTSGRRSLRFPFPERRPQLTSHRSQDRWRAAASARNLLITSTMKNEARLNHTIHDVSLPTVRGGLLTWWPAWVAGVRAVTEDEYVGGSRKFSGPVENRLFHWGFRQ
jgi:hypothetical protein